jgi:hypothetical protein
MPSILIWVYQDSDLLPAEVESDGSAELRRGAGEEHLLHVARDLVQDHGSRERVAVHHPHPQVGVFADEQRAAAIQRLVLNGKRERGGEEIDL